MLNLSKSAGVVLCRAFFLANDGTEEQIGQVDDSIEVSLQMTPSLWGLYIFLFLPSGLQIRFKTQAKFQDG